MCGIAAIFNPLQPRNPERLSQSVLTMLGRMKFRGPDHADAWADEYYAGGTTRLSITGGSRRGNQPLHDEAGGVFVFNGELYDRKDVMNRLGERFDPEQSDGVALAQVLQHHGPEGLHDVSAMFALAYYNQKNRSLLLARDAFGQKPLYYTRMNDGTFVFATTITSLNAVAGPFHLREEAIDEYLCYKSIGGNLSAYEGVEQLPPGSWMRIDAEARITTGSWNRLPDPVREEPLDPDETAEHLLTAIEQRLSDHHRAVVFLSGGLDSSIVAAGVCRLNPVDEQPLALSIGYDIEGMEDETGYAHRLAEELGMEHEVVVLKSEDVPDLIDDVAVFLEDPIQDPITVPFLHICRVASQASRVVLTGDGSDEFWGGYDRFEDPPDTVEEYLPRSMVFHADELKSHMAPASYLESITIDDHLDPLDRIMRVEVRNRLRNYHLARIDKLSMSCALEARTPFLDLRLANLALETPARFKRDGSRVKVPLLDASEKLLPKWLLDRTKQPFTGPILGWLRSSLQPRLKELAHNADPRVSGRVDIDGVLARLDDPKTEARASIQVWSLLFLESWLKTAAVKYAGPAVENLDEA